MDGFLLLGCEVYCRTGEKKKCEVYFRVEGVGFIVRLQIDSFLFVRSRIDMKNLLGLKLIVY